MLARQRIDLKHQVLFPLKNNEKIFMNVVYRIRDWGFKHFIHIFTHIVLD